LFLSVGLCAQDYNHLCLAVMIRATVVNTQTHRRTAFARSYCTASTYCFHRKRLL